MCLGLLPTIVENQREKGMENEMETLGPFKGICTGVIWGCHSQ